MRLFFSLPQLEAAVGLRMVVGVGGWGGAGTETTPGRTQEEAARPHPSAAASLTPLTHRLQVSEVAKEN